MSGAYRSIGELFDASVAAYAARAAYVNMGTAITYRQLDWLTRCFAGYLQGTLKLPQGTRVALMMPNILQYPVSLFGALRAGYTVVNCNPLYTPRELEHQLKDSGAEAIVILANFASTLAQVVARTAVKHVIVTQLGDMLGFPKRTTVNFVVRFIKRMVPAWHIPGAMSFRSALRQAAGGEWKPVDVRPDDIAFLQYTGGTTGVPKGAMLSHGNMVANLQQAHAWLKSFLEEGRETIITPLPLYHVFALTANCLVFLKIGATNVLITNPRDISRFVKELARHPFSVITGVNTLYNALLNDPDFAKLDFSRLKALSRRRLGHPRVGGKTLAAGHWETPDRSLRPDGNLAGCYGQSTESARVQRIHRASPAVDRDRDPRRPRATTFRSAMPASSACVAPR